MNFFDNNNQSFQNSNVSGQLKQTGSSIALNNIDSSNGNAPFLGYLSQDKSFSNIAGLSNDYSNSNQRIDPKFKYSNLLYQSDMFSKGNDSNGSFNSAENSKKTQPYFSNNLLNGDSGFSKNNNSTTKLFQQLTKMQPYQSSNSNLFKMDSQTNLFNSLQPNNSTSSIPKNFSNTNLTQLLSRDSNAVKPNFQQRKFESNDFFKSDMNSASKSFNQPDYLNQNSSLLPSESENKIKKPKKTYKPKKKTCGVCQKLLSSKFALENHMRTHTNEKPFNCYYKNCTKGFSTAFNRDRHVKIHEKAIRDLLGISFEEYKQMKTDYQNHPH